MRSSAAAATPPAGTDETESAFSQWRDLSGCAFPTVGSEGKTASSPRMALRASTASRAGRGGAGLAPAPAGRYLRQARAGEWVCGPVCGPTLAPYPRTASRAVSRRHFPLRTMLVDSHCHLDFPDFAGELDAVVARARAAGIARIVTISTRVKRHAEVLAIAERFADVYCSVGTHPHHAHEELDIAVDELVGRTRHSKVVAIGEAGLDYHYDSSPRAAQEQGLRNHIAAARATGLPLVIHSREADADMA